MEIISKAEDAVGIHTDKFVGYRDHSSIELVFNREMVFRMIHLHQISVEIVSADAQT